MKGGTTLYLPSPTPLPHIPRFIPLGPGNGFKWFSLRNNHSYIQSACNSRLASPPPLACAPPPWCAECASVPRQPTYTRS